MNNLSSYCGLVDAKIRASEKDLPVIDELSSHINTLKKKHVLKSTKLCFFFRWYPPGHGDFYHSFYNSGLLDELIEQGKTICFMSNIDNMGATVDLGILSECMKDDMQFFMEVTDKTRADVKGGTLIKYEGKLRLLEVAQVSHNSF